MNSTSKEAVSREVSSRGVPRSTTRDGLDTPPPPRPEAGAGRRRIWLLLVVIFALFGLWALIPDPPRTPIVPTLNPDRPAVPLGPQADHPDAPPRPTPDAPPPGAPPLMERPAPDADVLQPGIPRHPEGDTPEPDPPLDRRIPPRVDAVLPAPTAPADLREPPAGTHPVNAEAFRRLPIKADDRLPVGGIGRGGIHVDQLALGSSYESGRCAGKFVDFSASARDRVNVCLRVVHPRDEDMLVLLWQKDGEIVRRSKLPIAPRHAYRTRAHLRLRHTHAGQWVVRVLSTDHVELARHAFEVRP